MCQTPARDSDSADAKVKDGAKTCWGGFFDGVFDTYEWHLLRITSHNSMRAVTGSPEAR